LDKDIVVNIDEVTDVIVEDIDMYSLVVDKVVVVVGKVIEDEVVECEVVVVEGEVVDENVTQNKIEKYHEDINYLMMELGLV
jgi:hypothetical protein